MPRRPLNFIPHFEWPKDESGGDRRERSKISLTCDTRAHEHELEQDERILTLPKGLRLIDSDNK